VNRLKGSVINNSSLTIEGIRKENFIMPDYKIHWEKKLELNDRRLSVIVFSLFFSWLLAFPFEGTILYEIAYYYQVLVHPYIFATIAVHLAGLILSGFVVKTMQSAKKLMLYSIVFCVIVSVIFLFSQLILWKPALLIASFLLGGCVASWGFFLRSTTPKHERLKTIADALIFCNIFAIMLEMTAVHISPHFSLALSIAILCIAFLFAQKLPQDPKEIGLESFDDKKQPVSISAPLIFLLVFIFIITINSGLMYQVKRPVFAHLEWLASWYWTLPYIAALYIIRNLPRKINLTNILYVAISMIGFSFIALMVLDRSIISYLIVNTLMLGAFGVYDLFWWSILGSMLDYSKNPAKILGIGLSANVSGILAGGLIGFVILSSAVRSYKPSLLALGVVCLTLAMLPPLLKRLTALLKNQEYLTIVSEMPVEAQIQIVDNLPFKEKLTDRENEILSHLITGKTKRMIAGELKLSENTVKTHIRNIYSKVGVQSRVELMNNIFDARQHPEGLPKSL